MKTLVAALAALALTPAAALAQDAAVANGAVQAEAAADPAVATHEAALRAVIESIRTDAVDYDTMTPELAEAVRAQSETVVAMLQGFGAVQTVDHVASQDGAHMFRVVFENAATNWMIAMNGEGKLAGLGFQPG